MRYQKYDYHHLSMIRHILKDGMQSDDRTGVGTRKVFGTSFKVDVSDGYLPLFRGRFIAARIAFEELMWMLRGQTDVGILQEKKIHIWDGNSSAEYLKTYGKEHIEPNTIGKGYGYQFRNFNGVDQLEDVVSGIQNNPNGRRHVISLWNPADFDDMSLHPCHFLYEFMVTGNTLNIHQHLRSADVILGNPTNIVFATMFLGLVAKLCKLEAGTVWQTATDAHIYENHVQPINDLLDVIEGRETEWLGIVNQKPTWKINKEFDTLEEMLNVQWEDIEVENYQYLTKYGRKEFPMAV